MKGKATETPFFVWKVRIGNCDPKAVAFFSTRMEGNDVSRVAKNFWTLAKPHI